MKNKEKFHVKEVPYAVSGTHKFRVNDRYLVYYSPCQSALNLVYDMVEDKRITHTLIGLRILLACGSTLNK